MPEIFVSEKTLANQRLSVHEAFGPYRGKVVYHENIMAPCTEDWEVLSDERTLTSE